MYRSVCRVALLAMLMLGPTRQAQAGYAPEEAVALVEGELYVADESSFVKLVNGVIVGAGICR